jgi:hypothetical protein
VFTISKAIALEQYGVGYNFKLDTSAANHTAVNLDLGAIIPAKARVMAIEVVATNNTVSSAGASDITIAVGNASGGAQFIAAASCDDQNEVVGITNPDLPAAVKMNYAAATKIWMTFDPDQNWNTITNGEWRIYITYIQY